MIPYPVNRKLLLLLFSPAISTVFIHILLRSEFSAIFVRTCRRCTILHSVFPVIYAHMLLRSAISAIFASLSLVSPCTRE